MYKNSILLFEAFISMNKFHFRNGDSCQISIKDIPLIKYIGLWFLWRTDDVVQMDCCLAWDDHNMRNSSDLITQLIQLTALPVLVENDCEVYIYLDFIGRPFFYSHLYSEMSLIYDSGN